ncbi:DDE-type integrase/transposase/recombinase [Nocardioides nitrophenolicus]|uniref:DDE-type integrase/transposase/recombinase n=1 Tax=Nocardioides nitrophenolicus TaxID=60489 RepID=UPI001EF94DD2|nr:DDE-type integrase/transposase/recombinase [Nocardioides nitrophenolicus]
MSKARLVITAVAIEGRTVTEVAQTYQVSRSWIYELLSRYRTEGDAAFEPRSRRPHTSPTAIDQHTIELITGIRKQLTQSGLDAGPDTITWHLRHHHDITVSASTIARTLNRQSLVQPEPKKRPKSSYIRFEAEQPNETWQSDFTHYRLTDGTDTEILTWLDDHSRYALHVSAHPRITGRIVLDTFTQTAGQHAYPASVLTDNGLVYTTRFSGGRGGRNGLETELQRLNILQKNSRPNHPTTCGKVERFQQTMKNWLTAQPNQPVTITELQTLIDAFTAAYNHTRLHRSLERRATPATAYQARPTAGPTADRSIDTHHRVLSDTVDKDGKVSLRLAGRMHHIGIGREHTRTQVLKLVDGLHVRVINAATGELLRDLTMDTTRDYQPLGRPRGPKPRKPRRPDPSSGSGLSGIS